MSSNGRKRARLDSSEQREGDQMNQSGNTDHHLQGTDGLEHFESHCQPEAEDHLPIEVDHPEVHLAIEVDQLEVNELIQDEVIYSDNYDDDHYMHGTDGLVYSTPHSEDDLMNKSFSSPNCSDMEPPSALNPDPDPNLSLSEELLPGVTKEPQTHHEDCLQSSHGSCLPEDGYHLDFNSQPETDPVASESAEPESELHHILSSLVLADEDRELQPEANSFMSNEPDEDQGDPLLYVGAPITLHQSFVSILTLVLRYKLSGVCLKSVLDLISMHLPKTDNKFNASLSFFKKHFADLQGAKEFEYYCSSCLKRCEQEEGCQVCKNNSLCYLVKISLIDQLQTLFSREGFYEKLRFDNKTEDPNSFSDIYDGELYQEQVKKGNLGRDGHLSFLRYTDGAALFKSNHMSVWPFNLIINELSYSQRFKTENVLVPAIWCGPVKPPGNLLVQAVYPPLKELYSGVQFEVQNHGQKTVKATVLNGSGDTPARSLMMHTSQFNGEYSCQACEQKGQCRFNCPGVRVFPYDPEQMVPRTVKRMEEYAKIGSEKQACVGVKGPSGLAKIMPDFVRGTAIDPMHQVYGGVGKKVLHLLLSTKKEAEKWSISKKFEELDSRLTSIRPPTHVPRVPRSLKDLAYFKINELKAWLLDYSLPILDGQLSLPYMKHHASLVAAIQLMNADVVSKDSLSTAGKLLNEYISQFADFYSLDFLTINFHLLLHLEALVALQGPLWVFSCFPMESINGVVLSLVHGTRWAERQIATSVQACLGLPELVKNLPESESKEFCTTLLNHKKFVSNDVISGSVIIGNYQVLSVIPDEMNSHLEQFNVHQNKVLIFHSLKRGKYVFVAVSGKVSLCRDSSIALFTRNGISEVEIVQTFLRIFKCHCTVNCNCESNIYVYIQKLAIVKEFPTLIPDVFVPNTHQYEVVQDYCVVCAENLRGVCVKMEFGGNLYVSRPCNKKECE